jgi:arsenate reductase (glutaredoxin)
MRLSLGRNRMAVTIYHNPRCSKSRTTLGLLRDKGVEPEIVEYLKEPPDAATLGRLLAMLRLEPRDLMRKKEPEYKENDLGNPSLSREELIAAMVAHPKLIERPIVVKGDIAILGRPPERVLNLL